MAVNTPQNCCHALTQFVFNVSTELWPHLQGTLDSSGNYRDDLNTGQPNPDLFV